MPADRQAQLREAQLLGAPLVIGLR